MSFTVRTIAGTTALVLDSPHRGVDGSSADPALSRKICDHLASMDYRSMTELLLGTDPRRAL